MTTPTNWPNPERPGVPMFPERDGWHWLSYGQKQEPVPFKWYSEEFSDAPTEWAWETDNGPEDASVIARYFCYHGPILTPTKIAELLAGERERAVNACLSQKEVFASPEYAGGPLGAVMERFACDQCIQEIRNLGAAL